MKSAIGDGVWPKKDGDRLPLAVAGMEGADDSDVWGLLASLFATHPEWPDARCREIIRDCVARRNQDCWQSELLAFWPRWKQHHRELREGLVRLGRGDWVEKCRFCAIWSASRPVMAPFGGVAEILLGDNAEKAGPVVPNQPRIVDDMVFLGPKKIIGSEVVVVSAHPDLASFSEQGASRQLVWALDQSGLSWSLCQPWDHSIEIDPKITKAVIFWSYLQLNNDFVYHALALEKVCHALQIPVINSISGGWDARHSTILGNFQKAGIHCPKFQKFCNVDEIELAFPMILRVDGIHRGKQMHLVHSLDAARELVDEMRARFLSQRGGQILPPPNLAIEYIDVADSQGNFNKFRAYVVGKTVILRHQTIGKHWLVNFESCSSVGPVGQAGKSFMQSKESDLVLLARAGQASGSEVTALDYSRTQDGEYIFWEANRLFRMNGDKDYAISEQTSESVSKRRAETDRRLGQSLLTLLQERLSIH